MKRIYRLFACLILALSLLVSCSGRPGGAESEPLPDQTADVTEEFTGEGAGDETPDYGFPAPEGYSLSFTLPMRYGVRALIFKSDKRDAAKKAAESYYELLKSEGYETVSQREYGRFVFLTLEKGEDALHLTFDGTARTLRVIRDSKERSIYRLDDKAEYGGRASVIQLDNDHSSSDVGMSYIICLRDGSFALIDGGHAVAADADLIWKTLQEKTGGEKPHIRMWILTHAHSDHSGAFALLSEKYGSRVTLDALLCSDVVEFTHVNNEKQRTGDDYLSYYDGALLLTPQTGNMITAGGITFEFLYTYTDHYPQIPSCLNDSSIVFRVTAGKSLLILGDLQTGGADFLSGMYGSLLKSDVVQFAHHGYRNGASETVYSLVDAKIGLWPSSSALRASLVGSGPAGKAAEGMEKVYVSSDGTEEITLEE